MIEETVNNTGTERSIRRRRVLLGQGGRMAYTTWEWTRSSRRRRPATAGCRHRRPVAAYAKGLSV